MVSLRLPHRSVSHTCCLLTLLLTLVYRPSPVTANYEHYCDSGTFNYQSEGQCGERLASTILNLCRALTQSFMGKYIMKRMPPKATAEKRLNDITLSKADALSYLTNRAKRQGEQNVVCECCVNQCSFTEMYQYCELPPMAFKRRIRGYASNRDSHNQQFNRNNNLEDSNHSGSN